MHPPATQLASTFDTPKIMKTACFSGLPSVLWIAAGLAACSMAAEPVRAENPFKFLGNKAKQGITKVARTVDPRRVVRTVKNAVVASVPPPRVRPARTLIYPPGSKPAPYVPSAASRPLYGMESPDGQTAPSSPYNRPLSQSGGAVPSRLGAEPIELYSSPPGPARPDQGTIREVAPIRNVPLSADGTNLALEMPDRLPAPASQAAPATGAPSPSITPPSPAAASPTPPPSPPPREDLPFGELVPGKTGFVHSPYSKQDLVDVSGIPTGTKVKCPYTGKTFRVP